MGSKNSKRMKTDDSEYVDYTQIEKPEEKIKNIHLLSEGFTKLHNIYTFKNYIPKPSYCPSNELFYITTSYKEINSGIYSFNIYRNDMIITHLYDTNNKTQRHTQFIDEENDILYIFGCSSNMQKFFYSFNIKTQELISTHDHKLNECDVYPTIAYISYPYNQYHIVTEYQHFQYDINTKTVHKLDCDQLINENIPNPQMLYVPLKHQLTMFGGNASRKMLYFNYSVNSNNDKYNEWKVHDITMPHRSTHYDLLGFYNTVIVFYFPSSGYNDIWFLDILGNKWYKSRYCVPKYIDSPYNIYVLKDKFYHNYIHICDFNKGYHLIASLHDLMPHELYKRYVSQYRPLVNAYINKMEIEGIVSTVPYDVRKLIWKYYISVNVLNILF